MSEDIVKLTKRVCQESGKTEEEINKQMQERKEKTHGLLSDYGALYAVAKGLGIDLNEGSDSEIEFTKLGELSISPALNIIGRVKTVFGEREFSKKDGSKGCYSSLILIDKTGECRVVFWDQKSEEVNKVSVGDILLLKNTYSKEHQEKTEVHAGNYSIIKVNPKDVDVDLPEITRKTYEIKDLEKDLSDLNFSGRVFRYFPLREFERKDGSVGKRASFIAEDETGRIRVVLWDNAAETNLNEGEIIDVENGYTRLGLNDDLEVHVGSRGSVKKSDKKLDLPELENISGDVSISQIKPDLSGLNVKSRVLTVYPSREYSNGMMASMIIGDDTGSLRLVLWNEQSNNAEKLNPGDEIYIKNGYSKSNLNQEPELHAGKYSEIILEKKNKTPTKKNEDEENLKTKKISEIETGGEYVKITGKITAVNDIPLFFYTCPECSGKVQEISGSWMCDNCGMVESTENMMASIILEDASSNIRIVGYRDVAEKIIGFTVDEALTLIGESDDEKAPLKIAREKLVGKRVSILGTTRFNDYSDNLEIFAEDIKTE